MEYVRDPTTGLVSAWNGYNGTPESKRQFGYGRDPRTGLVSAQPALPDFADLFMQDAAGQVSRARSQYDPSWTVLDFALGFHQDPVTGKWTNHPATTFGANWTFSRPDAQVAYAETVGGLLVPFAANEPRITDKGLLVEETRANKSANAVLNPQSTAGVVLTGDAAATLTLVDDSEALARLGLKGNVYKFDNSTAAAGSQVAIAGTTGNTNPHVASAYVRTTGVTGGRIQGANASGASASFAGATYARYTAALTPSNASGQMVITAQPGQVVYFILNQLEEGASATSPITAPGATRNADVATLAGVTVSAADFTVLAAATGTASTGFPAILRYENGDLSNSALFYENGTSAWMDARNAGVTSSHSLAGGVALTNPIAFAVSRVLGQTPRRSVNGAAAGVVPNSGSAVVPVIAADLIKLTFAPTPYNGYIRKVALLPVAANDVLLQALSVSV